MKLFSRLCLTAAGLVMSAHIASAATLSLASYGSTAVAPSGVSNSAVYFTALGFDTYNIGTGGVWANPLGNSSWVSFNKNTYPGGSVVAPNSDYFYYTTFTDNTARTSSGSITVMADDTTSVYLNGTQITPAAPANPASACTKGTPNCITPATYNLTGFVNGTNVLSFVVHQDFGSATGLDFVGSVNTLPTPEPSSLMLLGSGLLSGAGTLLRRRRA